MRVTRLVSEGMMLRMRDFKRAYKVKDGTYKFSFVRKMPPVTGWTSKDRESLAGSCDYASKRICVAMGQEPEERLSTAIHEVLHAIDHEWKVKLTHDQIYLLEEALLRLLLDNELVT